jgi:hypothetical protein
MPVEIIQMPTSLDRLADQIRADLERRDQSWEGWIETTLDLCQHLAEARAAIRDNITFNQWCNRQGFRLNDDDRAAAVAIGKDIAKARAVLERTERRSLRYIHKLEYGPRYVAKNKAKLTRPDPPAPPPPRPRSPPRPARRTKLTDDMREQVAGRLVAGEPQADIVRAVNTGRADKDKISVTVVKTVKAELDAGLIADPNTSVLSATKQQQFDRALRAARIQLRAELLDEVREEVRKTWEEVFLPHHREQREFAERIIAGRKGVMSRAEYRKLLACLHPDSITDDDRKPRYVEAFQLVRRLEGVLVKPDPESVQGAHSRPLPATLAELMAARKRGRR